MARITIGFNVGTKVGDKHTSKYVTAAAVTDADLVVSFDTANITSKSQFKTYLMDALAQVNAGQGGLAP